MGLKHAALFGRTGNLLWSATHLQPAIKSRHYPYPSIDNYVVANAQLTQIKMRYNLQDTLSLKAPKNEVLRGSYSHPSCK